jgi:hypothetical protein
MTEMDIITALAVIEDAVSRSQAENVNTPEVLAALDFLEAKADAGWPSEQFRKVLAPREGELDLDKVGRSQVLNAALNGIKRAISPRIGARHWSRELGRCVSLRFQITIPAPRGVQHGQKHTNRHLLQMGVRRSKDFIKKPNITVIQECMQSIKP